MPQSSLYLTYQPERYPPRPLQWYGMAPQPNPVVCSCLGMRGVALSNDPPVDYAIQLASAYSLRPWHDSQ
jgi:hypothetical protein